MKKVLGSKTEWAHGDYDLIRGLLFNNSAGFQLLVEDLKAQYRLNNLSKAELKNRLFISEVSDGLKPLNEHLERICDRLGIMRQFLEDLIIGEAGINPLIRNLPIYFAISVKPLPEGIYIRVDPHTRFETVRDSFKVIKHEWERIFQESETDGTPPRIPKKDKSISDLRKKIEMYELIEKTILENYKLKGTGDQAEQLVTDAIKFAAEEFSLSPVSVKSAYYSLLDYYQIHTFSEFRSPKFLI